MADQKDRINSGESTAKNVLVQGTILAGASIIAKVIGLIYRIPLYNILGDVGNSYYSTANEIYSIILMISSFSLPLAVSRLMSERIQKGEMRNANKVFLCAMRFAVISGGLLALITYLFSGILTKQIMNLEYAKYGLRVLAPAILIFAITGGTRMGCCRRHLWYRCFGNHRAAVHDVPLLQVLAQIPPCDPQRPYRKERILQVYLPPADPHDPSDHPVYSDL